GAAREGGKILHGGGFRSGCRNDDGIFESTSVLKNLHELGNRGALLSAGHINAVELFLFRTILMNGLLVQNSIENDCSLAGLAVTYDQLALAAANGNQRINSLEARRHRLMHRLARNNAGRLHVNA